MVYTNQDFAELYCCSVVTIRRKTAHILPLFKNSDPKKRKRTFSLPEAQIIVINLGLPPKNKLNTPLAIILLPQKWINAHLAIS